MLLFFRSAALCEEMKSLRLFEPRVEKLAFSLFFTGCFLGLHHVWRIFVLSLCRISCLKTSRWNSVDNLRPGFWGFYELATSCLGSSSFNVLLLHGHKKQTSACLLVCLAWCSCGWKACRFLGTSIRRSCAIYTREATASAKVALLPMGTWSYDEGE